MLECLALSHTTNIISNLLKAAEDIIYQPQKSHPPFLRVVLFKEL